MFQRSLFGVDVDFLEANGAWWWRVWHWAPYRRTIGPYATAQEAVRDAAALLYLLPELRTMRA